MGGSAQRTREVSGSGDWRVVHSYGGGAGVQFDQSFEFKLAAGKGPPLPLTGGSVKVPIRVVTRSEASGDFQDGTSDPPKLVRYTCSTTSTRTVRATVSLVRRGRGRRATVAPIP